MLNSFTVLLDIAAALILLGFFLLGVYETVAIINAHISLTPDIPLITALVRPWIMAHKMIALGIAALIFAAFFWLFFHFFLTA
jgi:hypothetical protein